MGSAEARISWARRVGPGGRRRGLSANMSGTLYRVPRCPPYWPMPGVAERLTEVEGRAGMGTNWRDVKTKARAADPEWDSAQRVKRRARMRREMLTAVSGTQLAEIRKQLGLTQAQLAEATGLPRARISQIENDTATSLEILRVYVAGLGGRLDVVARIGNIRLKVG